MRSSRRTASALVVATATCAALVVSVPLAPAASACHKDPNGPFYGPAQQVPQNPIRSVLQPVFEPIVETFTAPYCPRTDDPNRHGFPTPPKAPSSAAVLSR